MRTPHETIAHDADSNLHTLPPESWLFLENQIAKLIQSWQSDLAILMVNHSRQ